MMTKLCQQPPHILPSRMVQEPLASHPQLSGNMEHGGFAYSQFIHFFGVLLLNFISSLKQSLILCLPPLFLSSLAFPPLAQSTQKCNKCLMNQAGGIQMQAALTVEPSMRQELCLGSIRYWHLLNPHDDSASVFSRFGGSMMCPRT